MLRDLEFAIIRSGIAATVGLLLAAVPGLAQRLENQSLSLAANQQDASDEGIRCCAPASVQKSITSGSLRMSILSIDPRSRPSTIFSAPRARLP